MSKCSHQVQIKPAGYIGIDREVRGEEGYRVKVDLTFLIFPFLLTSNKSLK